ncbi:hypothetical protein NKH05_32585, partial [Mesorhizobium sp. M1399]
MRQYRAQQQGLERQLSELNLGGSAADPDSGAIRRTSMGGSMRMPRQPSLRDNQISSARHSIDASYAASSHSRSRHSTASSEAYSSFSEEPAITPPPKKSGGLRSLLKAVKKAFVPSSGKQSSKDGMHQPEVVKTTYRADYAKRGRPAAEDQTIIPDEDETIITDFIARAPGLGVKTVRPHATSLRKFSAWLQTQPEGRTLAGLLDAPGNPDDPNGLTGRANAFAHEAGVLVSAALVAVQQVRTGNLPHPRRRSTGDEHLISQVTKVMHDARERNPDVAQSNTVVNWVSALRKFSVWLQEQPRNLTVASLVDDPGALNARAEQFVNERGDRRVNSSLKSAVEVLLDWRAGIDPSRRTPRPIPYADDARLIEGLLNQELASLGPESTSKERIQVITSRRRRFSDWLRRQGKASIASRVNGNQEQTQGLKDDIRAFTVVCGYRSNLRLNDLRKYQQVVEANAAWGMQPPQQSGQSPVEGYDQDQLWDELPDRERQGPAE